MTGEEAGDPFEGSRACFDALVGLLDSDKAGMLSHGELEERLDVEGRELLRQLFQDHLDLRALREIRIDTVADADGVDRGSVEKGHERVLTSIFGEVVVSRLAYRRRGYENLHPADASLNLPVERHSHGIRRLAAVEATRGSFDDAVDAIAAATGQDIGKRQVESLALRASVDIDEFYTVSPRHRAAPDDVVVLSADGKGIVMRPDALRPATAKAAASSTGKLATRLSKGEKRNRKRMAEVGAVYEITPAIRTPADILARHDDPTPRAPAPAATWKWLVASVVEDTTTVMAQIFDEAERRDPDHQRTWIALVDGNNHQIDRITQESARRKLNVTVIVDFVHVLEYLWKAAWSFHTEGDPKAEQWVHEKAVAVLEGHASTVAASIRRKATCLHLTRSARLNADLCANYLLAKQPYLDYPNALDQGWPIATGVIEGACRHLVKDV